MCFQYGRCVDFVLSSVIHTLVQNITLCKVKLPTFSNELVEFRTVTSFSYKGNFIENVLLLLKCVLFLVYSYCKVTTLSNNSTVEFIKV